MNPKDRERYNVALAKLIRMVRATHKAGGAPSWTMKRKNAAAVARRLDELVSELEASGTLQFDIEAEHDRAPDLEIGSDGWARPGERVVPSYKATLWHMRALADSARRVADAQPNPRERHALRLAAHGLLHLRYELGCRRPRLTGSSDVAAASEEILDLKRICDAADIVLSDERLRGALSAALKEFDPFFDPYHIRDQLV